MGKYKIILVLIAILGVQSCSNSESSTTSKKNTPFQTTAPSRIYFKNMRSINYSSESINNNQMDAYRFRKLDNVKNRLIVFPEIIDYWMADQAFLRIAYNEVYHDSLYTDSLLIKKEQNQEKLHLKPNNPIAETELVIKIHKALQDDSEFFSIKKDQSKTPVLEDKMDRYYFNQIMTDYFRLIDSI